MVSRGRRVTCAEAQTFSSSLLFVMFAPFKRRNYSFVFVLRCSHIKSLLVEGWTVRFKPKEDGRLEAKLGR